MPTTDNGRLRKVPVNATPSINPTYANTSLLQENMEIYSCCKKKGINMPHECNGEDGEPLVEMMTARDTRNADVDDDDVPLVTLRSPSPDEADSDVTSPLPKVHHHNSSVVFNP